MHIKKLAKKDTIFAEAVNVNKKIENFLKQHLQLLDQKNIQIKSLLKENSVLTTKLKKIKILVNLNVSDYELNGRGKK